MSVKENIREPIRRSAVRRRLGMAYYSAARRLLWLKMRNILSTERSAAVLPFCCFEHKTPLLRKLKDVDMWMQYNKIINLKIAAEKVNGLILRPGAVFSYWKLIGKPTRRKGYADGMVLKGGTVSAGTGGGLCQLSNLIFWMTLHTPLTVIERHRHGYDVFPDSNRTQPFGSGATCFYPHGDLMIQNNTQETYQLSVHVGEENLEGEWRSSAQPDCTYEIVERNHEMKSEYWGGYSRHNTLYQQRFDLNGSLIDEQLVAENHALMMYSPFLASSDTGNT